MKESQLKSLLEEGARESGMCAEGFKRIHTSGKESLIAYYLSCPDWCLERNYPSIEILRTEFADCEDKGVYVDKQFDGELIAEQLVYVFHNCKGRIRVGWDLDTATIPMLYFANGCDMQVESDGVARLIPIRVPIYLFGDQKVEAKSDTSTVFNVYKEGMYDKSKDTDR